MIDILKISVFNNILNIKQYISVRYNYYIFKLKSLSLSIFSNILFDLDPIVFVFIAAFQVLYKDISTNLLETLTKCNLKKFKFFYNITDFRHLTLFYLTY